MQIQYKQDGVLRTFLIVFLFALLLAPFRELFSTLVFFKYEQTFQIKTYIEIYRILKQQRAK